MKRLNCLTALVVSLSTVVAAQETTFEFPTGPEIPQAKKSASVAKAVTQPTATAQPQPADHGAAAATDASGGNVEVVRTRYPNRRLKIEKQVVQNSKCDFVNHGAWRKWDETGNLIGKGAFDLGRQHGKWTQVLYANTPTLEVNGESVLPANLDEFKRPFINEATFEKGELVGAWSIVDSLGRGICTLHFHRDKLHGKLTTWYPSGQKYRELHFSDNTPAGSWTVWNERGKVANRSQYVAGYTIVPHKSTHPTGEAYMQGNYLRRAGKVKLSGDYWDARIGVTLPTVDEDVRHGEWVTLYANGGTRFRGSYRAGKPVGPHRWWYPNGQMQAQGNFTHGRRTGRWVSWHENGMRKMQGAFHAGSKIGTWLFWNEDGKLVDYRDGSSLIKPVVAPSAPSTDKSEVVRHKQSIEKFERLARQNPANAEYRVQLAEAHNLLGSAYAKAGDKNRALAAYKDARAIAEVSRRSFPHEIKVAVVLAGSCVNVAGNIQTADSATAELQCTKAISLLAPLVQSQPSDQQARTYLRNAYWGRAKAREVAGNYSGAAADWEQALRLDDGKHRAQLHKYFTSATAKSNEAAQ